LIKHISFDLWLTLIKSHPEFKEGRAEFLKKEFNPNALSVRQIIEIVQNTDKVCDRRNEMNGKKIQAEFMYRRILLKLGMNPESISDDMISTIKNKINYLFMNFQPQYLNESVQPIIHFLKEEGYSLNISSNTGFINGNIIVDTLKNLNIFRYFDFCIF
jgi:putative hydrolase of the HAD superfamily